MTSNKNGNGNSVEEEGGVLIIVMGTSGSGKSTLGSSLASSLNFPFIDGDDLHPKSNVEKMGKGKALDDNDREPWLKKIREVAWNRISEQNPLKNQNRDDERGNEENLKDHLRKDEERLEEKKEKLKLAEVFETSHLNSSNGNRIGNGNQEKEEGEEEEETEEKVNDLEKKIEEINHEGIKKELETKTSLKHINEISNDESSKENQIHQESVTDENKNLEFKSISKGKGCVIACSALKNSYRSLLRGEINSLNSNSNSNPTLVSNSNEYPNLRVIHLYLRLPPSLLLSRMHERKGHFMKEGMLKSQLETLQEPNPENERDIIVLEAVKEKNPEGLDGKGKGEGEKEEKSKEGMNFEASEKCRELLGW